MKALAAAIAITGWLLLAFGCEDAPPPEPIVLYPIPDECPVSRWDYHRGGMPRGGYRAFHVA